MTKIYVTKYSLTAGITEHDASISDDTSVASFRENGYWHYFHGKDFQLTKEDAINRAEEMRIKKLKSLDKQIKKLSALNF